MHKKMKVRRRERKLLPSEAYLLTLKTLNMNYLTFLYSVSEGTVSNTLAWEALSWGALAYGLHLLCFFVKYYS